MKVRALIGALVVLGLAVVAVGRDGGGEGLEGQSAEAGDPAGRDFGGGGPIAALREIIPLPDLDLAPDPEDEVRGPRFLIARVHTDQALELLDRPDGGVVARLSDRTEFGSPRAMGVAREGEGWLGVTAPELFNGQLGWVREDDPALELYETRFWLVADLSARRLDLRYGKRFLDRFPITVGSQASPTPLGRYSVTDALAGKGVGPYYGCCILALSGHQPNLPANWLGGDRIAIHGTPDRVGGAASTGCLRASDDDMVSLFARVPLGVPVFIRA
ncbi:MAG: L,D-transpeptidase [Solirubrobacterales bacterium]